MYVECYKTMKESALSMPGAGQHQFTFCLDQWYRFQRDRRSQMCRITFVSEYVYIFHVVFDDTFGI